MAAITAIGALLVMIILVFGTVWMGNSARRDTETAVRSVSMLYLDELAGRREQVVSNNLRERIRDTQTAVSLLTPDDLSSEKKLRDYQAHMKQLYNLEKFAFVSRITSPTMPLIPIPSPVPRSSS